MKIKLSQILVLIYVSILFFVFGMWFNSTNTISRHKEITKENNGQIEGYDRYDLHYITFGERLLTN